MEHINKENRKKSLFNLQEFSKIVSCSSFKVRAIKLIKTNQSLKLI